MPTGSIDRAALLGETVKTLTAWCKVRRHPLLLLALILSDVLVSPSSVLARLPSSIASSSLSAVFPPFPCSVSARD